MAEIVVRQAAGKRRDNLPAGVTQSSAQDRYQLSFEGSAAVDRRWIRCRVNGKMLKFNCTEVEQVTRDGAVIWPLPDRPVAVAQPVQADQRL